MIRELSMEEQIEVNGGFWHIVARFAVGSAVSLLSYAFNKHKKEEPMTAEGAATAATFGAVTGGIGGAAVGAAGGGVVANLAWRPGFIAINAAGQAIAQEQ
jgi:hypothetical protein